MNLVGERRRGSLPSVFVHDAALRLRPADARDRGWLGDTAPSNWAAASHAPPSPARPSGIENSAIGTAAPENAAFFAMDAGGAAEAVLVELIMSLPIDSGTTIAVRTPASSQGGTLVVSLAVLVAWSRGRLGDPSSCGCSLTGTWPC